MSKFSELAQRLNAAEDYLTFFPVPANGVVTHDYIRNTYRAIAAVVHPDRNSGRNHDAAVEAFKQLGMLHNGAQEALTEGRYGQPTATIRTKRCIHVTKRKLGTDDIAVRYQTASTVSTSAEHSDWIGLLRVAKSARDNDLMAAEARALKTLHSADDVLTRHYPRLLDAFMYNPGRRQATVVEWHSDSVNLQELHRAFPHGMDPLHVAWIWRRLLMAVGFAHDQGVVHGAVLPPHVLVLARQHGVILADWCYSVPMPVSDSESKTTIKAMASGYTAWYPEEILNKTPPSPATDLTMAARCMIHLLGGNPETGLLLPNSVPQRMRAYFKGCLQVKQSMRPQSARGLLDEYDELLERLGEPYYPRRFIELAVPAGAA